MTRTVSDDLDAAQLLTHALQQGLTEDAIAAAAQLGDRTTLITLTTNAWTQQRWSQVAAAFSALGLDVSSAAASAMNDALSAINGRRRSHLLTPNAIVTCLVEVRHNDDEPTVRRPLHNRSMWMKRRIERPFCEVTRRNPDQLHIELGTERVGSYEMPTRLDVAHTDTFAQVPTLEPSAPAPSVLPVHVAQRLGSIHTNAPNTYAFDAALDQLDALQGEPFYTTAVAQVESQFLGWTAQERAPSFARSIRSVSSPHGHL
ncbi:MAG: hypothetical protein AAFX99_29145, partial [Myxococcota bacterium]